MRTDTFSNNASGVLASGVGLEDTQFTLAEGAREFAELVDGEIQRATLTNETMPDAMEIVYITLRDGLSLTVERERELTAPFAWPAGTKVEARVTAGMLSRFLSVDENGVLRTKGGEGGRLAGSFVVNGAVDQGYQVVQLSGVQMLHRVGARPTKTFGGTRFVQDMNLSTETLGGSMFVELGTAVSQWVPGRSYAAREIVAPPVPTGFNYIFESNGSEIPYTNSDVDPGFSDSGRAIEAYDISGDILVGQWLPQPTPLAFEWVMPQVAAGVALTEVGFISYRRNATAAPVISIGVQADGDLVNAEVLVGPNSEDVHIHRYPVSPQGALVESLLIKVDTPAEGNFYGRFYWRGCLFDA